MKRRVLCALLTLCLLLALLPVTAGAEGTTGPEQFDLTPGGTYYFDLSGVDIPGELNDGVNNKGKRNTAPLPDLSLHYVPFTYTGTINAYVLNINSFGELTSSDAASNATFLSTDTEKQYGYTYEHSLLIADFNVTINVMWNDLKEKGLIFGKTYASSGVDYTMRAPSAGTGNNTPSNNEWDTILRKIGQDNGNNTGGNIENWKDRYRSWGQDTLPTRDQGIYGHPGRGPSGTADRANYDNPTAAIYYRPVLELPINLDRTALKAVTLDLNGGHVGTDSDRNNISIIVKSGESFTAPTAEGLTRPDGNADSYFKWLGSDGKVYAPGDSVPASVTSLTAQWTAPVVPVTPTTPAEEPATPWWTILPALDQTADFPFYDVDANDWFYEAVRSAWENELIDGVTARYFKPDSTLTVAQAIKLAAALHQKQSVGFVTLQNGGTHWYDNYVNYAVANGLIEAAYQSKSAETMNASVTRAEFVHILAKLLNAGTINTVNSIPDVKAGDAYADEIFAFYRAGILTGSDRLGTFHPESSLKRSEAAAILVRLYDASQRQYITLR